MLGFALTTEQEELVRTARQFVKDRIIPIAADCDRESKFPTKIYQEAHALGLVAPVIASEHGGVGLSELDHVLLTEELAYGCTGIQTSITASTLAATPLIVAGSDFQRKKYLGMLANEPIFAAYAITEPAAGSDAAGIQCRARKVGTDWVLDGQKCFITNASFARWYEDR